MIKISNVTIYTNWAISIAAIHFFLMSSVLQNIV